MTPPTLHSEVMSNVEAHAFSETRCEVGGILVGDFHETSVEVTAALPALKAAAGQTHVTFTHEVWEEIHATIDADHPGRKIVGWYHTHPGFGLFLSDYDTFIHENFFSDRRMVALVVDPLAGSRGWFNWVGDRIDLVDEGPTSRPPIVGATQSDQESSAGRRRLAASTYPVIGALALATAIGGYLLGSQSVDRGTVVSNSGTAVSTDTQAKNDDLEATRSEARKARRQSALLRARLERLRAHESVTRSSATQFNYEVHSGDSLWRIAAFIYGDGRMYPKLLAANPALGGKSYLDVGQTIAIPLDRSGREGHHG